MFCGFPVTSTSCLHGGLASSLLLPCPGLLLFLSLSRLPSHRQISYGKILFKTFTIDKIFLNEILKLPAHFQSIIYQSHHYLVLEDLADPYGIGSTVSPHAAWFIQSTEKHLDCQSFVKIKAFYKDIDWVSTAVKKHHDYGNSYKGNHFFGWLAVSEIQSIIIMEGHGIMQADLVLELRVLHLDKQVSKHLANFIKEATHCCNEFFKTDTYLSSAYPYHWVEMQTKMYISAFCSTAIMPLDQKMVADLGAGATSFIMGRGCLVLEYCCHKMQQQNKEGQQQVAWMLWGIRTSDCGMVLPTFM
ncbi:hypothetical protein STEG23_014328, partial [Scotinomys teguina]